MPQSFFSIKISGSRRCVLSIGKEKCAPDWIDPIIEQKCQAYSYLVLHYNFTEPVSHKDNFFSFYIN